MSTEKTPNVRAASSVLLGTKTRIIAWETAFCIALKNCYEELGRKVSIHVILVKGEYMQSSTFFFAENFCYY